MVICDACGKITNEGWTEFCVGCRMIAEMAMTGGGIVTAKVEVTK